MTLNLDLSPIEEEKLRKRAEEKGVPVEKMLRDAALVLLGETGISSRQRAAVFDRRIGSLQHLLPHDSALSDDSLRRENLYADED